MKTFEIKAGNEIRSNVCALNHAVNIRVIAWLVLKKGGRNKETKRQTKIGNRVVAIKLPVFLTLKFRGSS